jgi:hypothetical protein
MLKHLGLRKTAPALPNRMSSCANVPGYRSWTLNVLNPYGGDVLKQVVLGPDSERKLTTQVRRLCLSAGKVTGV